MLSERSRPPSSPSPDALSQLTLPRLGQRLLAKLEDRLPVVIDRRCHPRPDMVYVPLGRTGLRVSVMGLGCGGFSRLGLGTGKTHRQAAGLVRSALALGINLIDTAEAYGTETVVGRALRGVPRESVILSTKKVVDHRRRILTPQDLIASLDRNLQRLGTDYIDIYHLHGVKPDCYAAVADALVPTLETLREAGKIRFLGIT
ncbi:MAG: aldo/keto reductase, partial [Gloeomargaritaceae cyanobacterium C42_A2020_066]|nr:aldo/keto reductase [Gloeomargaritaceae cyanobacterium C42_A2020_066]